MSAVSGFARNAPFGLCLVIMTGLLVACESAGSRSGVGANSQHSPEGFQYFVPRHQVVVAGTATYRLVNSVNESLKIENEITLADVQANVSLRSVQDRAFTIELDTSAFSKLDDTVSVTDQGFLAGVNSSSEGKGGDVIVSIAKIAGAAAGAFVGLESADSAEATADLAEKIMSKKDDRAATAIALLPPDQRYFLTNSDRAKVLWKELFLASERTTKLRSSIDKRQIDLIDQLEPQAKTTLTKIAMLREALSYQEARRSTAKTAFDAAFDAYKAREKIGAFDTTITINETFEFHQIPRTMVSHGMRTDKARAQIASLVCPDGKSGNSGCYAGMLKLYDQTGILVTANLLREVSESTGELESPKGDLVIHYRRPIPIVLSVFQKKSIPVPKEIDGSADTTKPDVRLVHVSSSLQNVMHPNTTPMALAFDRSAFSDRTFELTVNANGDVTKLRRTSTATASAAASSVDQGIAGGLGSLSQTLTSIAAIDKQRRDLELARLQSKVKLITEEKNRVDAELALEGAESTAELQQQKKQLDAQLATLNSQFALVNAESSQELKETQAELALLQAQAALDEQNATVQLLLGQKVLETKLAELKAQLEFDQQSAGSLQASELDQLKRQTAIIQERINLLKAEQELSALTR